MTNCFLCEGVVPYDIWSGDVCISCWDAYREEYPYSSFDSVDCDLVCFPIYVERRLSASKVGKDGIEVDGIW